MELFPGRNFRAPLAVGLVLFTTAFAHQATAKKAPPTSIEAVLVSIQGHDLIVDAADDRHFKRMTVSTGSHTSCKIESKSARLTDLHPGDRVIVSPPGGTAALVEEVRPKSSRPPEVGLIEGFVVSAASDTVAIRTPLSRGEIVDMKIPLQASTVILVGSEPAKAADLKSGQSVLVAMSGGAARRIAVQTAPQN